MYILTLEALRVDAASNRMPNQALHSSVDSCLDLSPVLRVPDRDHGARLLPRIKDSPAPALPSPGPGDYFPPFIAKEPTGKNRSGSSFGRESRDMELRRSDACVDIAQFGRYDPASQSRDRPGYSFSLVRRVTERAEAAEFSPGPGYYASKDSLTREKPAGFSISSAADIRSGGGLPLLSASLDPTADSAMQRAVDNNFQRFGPLPRDSLGIVHGGGAVSQSIVERNKQSICKLSRARVLHLIQLRRKRQDYQIRSAQAAKESIVSGYAIIVHIGIEEDEARLAEERMQEHVRKIVISKDRSNVWKFSQAWIAIGTLQGWMSVIMAKYKNRCLTRKKTNRYLRIIFRCFLALGRICRRAHKIRTNKLLRSMRRIAYGKMCVWRMTRKSKTRERLTNFLKMHFACPMLLLLVKSTAKSVVLIQRWHRRYMAKRTLALSIMNIEWSVIERIMLTRSSTQTQQQMLAKQIFISDPGSDVVPMPVRLQYLNAILNVTLVRYTVW